MPGPDRTCANTPMPWSPSRTTAWANWWCRRKACRKPSRLADKIIGQSVRAVTSLVTQPGLIHIGMDDLDHRPAEYRQPLPLRFRPGQGRKPRRGSPRARRYAARCSTAARWWRSARNVLVHICGGNSLTLFEIETLMRELGKQVSEDAQILFGAATDAKLNDHLSVTILTSLNQPAPAPEPVAEEVIEPEVPVAEPAAPAAPVLTPPPSANWPLLRWKPSPRRRRLFRSGHLLPCQ